MKDLPNCQKRPRGRERGQRRDQKAFDGGYLLHNRTCKMELLRSLKPPSFQGERFQERPFFPPFLFTWVFKMKTGVSRWRKRPRGTGLPGCQLKVCPPQSTKYSFFPLEQAVVGKGGKTSQLCSCQMAKWLSLNCLVILWFS